MLRDPLVSGDFAVWFRRVFGVFRRSFGSLTIPALAPAVLTVAYLIAADLVDLDLEQSVLLVALFLVLLLVVGSWYVGSGFFLAIRQANGQPATLGQASRFAGPRMLPLVGWSVLVWLITLAVVLALRVPGYLLALPVLTLLGALLGAVLTLAAGAVVASLNGVVLLERGGLRRGIALIAGRFWATFGRMLVSLLLGVVYGGLAGLLTVGLSDLAEAGGLGSAGSVIVSILEAVLLIPGWVYLLAVSVVSYAGLRYGENRAITTRTLAAELDRARH